VQTRKETFARVPDVLVATTITRRIGSVPDGSVGRDFQLRSIPFMSIGVAKMIAI
jgi:hypothetical protein